MTAPSHEDVVRESFRRQVGLFTGPDSPFARREGALGWLGDVDPDTVVLEVACGAAHVAESIAHAVRQVVGIDLTRELLDLGAARLREAGVRNVVLQEGNGEALPFVDDQFDVVCCRTSLHHFADPTAAVQEMVRVAKPGGRVVVLDLVPPSSDVRERYDELHRALDPSHRAVLLEQELAEMFPPGVSLTYGDTVSLRLPLSVSVTEQSDEAEVVEALRAELDGGPPTGFEPSDDDGDLVVTFLMCTVHGTLDA